jgi:hypothetical protein
MFRCSLRLASDNQNIYKGLILIYIMENTINHLMIKFYKIKEFERIQRRIIKMSFRELIEMQVCFALSSFAFYSILINNYRNFVIACLLSIISNILIYKIERRKRK